ncbi:TPA: hypothetical protein ACHVGK_002042 [Streptococcus suis]
MRDLAQEQIDGKLTYQDVYDQISQYHAEVDASTQEADIVALRIVESLSSTAFKFVPTTLKAIHKELFYGLLPQGVKLGDYRTYNITKSEPILEGESVHYDHFQTISASLDYDFQ